MTDGLNGYHVSYSRIVQKKILFRAAKLATVHIFAEALAALQFIISLFSVPDFLAALKLKKSIKNVAIARDFVTSGPNFGR